MFVVTSPSFSIDVRSTETSSLCFSRRSMTASSRVLSRHWIDAAESRIESFGGSAACRAARLPRAARDEGRHQENKPEPHHRISSTAVVSG